MIKTGIYRHYKGNDYEVLNTVKHSETEEVLVLYKSVKSDQLWVRPLEMFTEEIVVENKKVQRFKLVSS